MPTYLVDQESYQVFTAQVGGGRVQVGIRLILDGKDVELMFGVAEGALLMQAFTDALVDANHLNQRGGKR